MRVERLDSEQGWAPSELCLRAGRSLWLRVYSADGVTEWPLVPADLVPTAPAPRDEVDG